MKNEISNSNDTLTKLSYLSDSLTKCESGIATYYDYNVPRITANGERYNNKALTCAYYRNTNEKRKYLGKYIKVCTDTCVVLKVNDNGAFRDAKYAHLNHIVDLTPYVMTLLGGSKRQGVLKVRVYY